MLTKEFIAEYFRGLQDRICNALEEEDGKARFHEDNWDREGGGGGRTRVMEGGAVFETAGVNFSEVYGKIPDFLKRDIDSNSDGLNFFATGVSIVIHPESPMVPIIHMNVRYFELSNGVWWFGGGIDLTPIYVDEEDARFFHRQVKIVCDKHDKKYYPDFKKWADDYFYIAHRKETRGVGGVFFDRLSGKSMEVKQSFFEFVKELGETFVPVYLPIVRKNKTIAFTEKNKQWQLLRRGRYVEFNLVYDKGTKFGLETNGRVESILMSLPKLASWEYNFILQKDSPESNTATYLKNVISWI